MDIKQLEGFVKLAKTLNFSLTAQSLFLSQPTLSHWIKQLEKELGFDLFKRTKREVELTTAGQSFYEDCQYLLEHFHKSVEKARGYSEKYSKQLVIAYENNSLALAHLSSIIQKFSFLYPEIQIILKSTNHIQKDSLFLDQKVDILFTVKDKVTKASNVIFEELYRGSYMCVLSPKHPLADKENLAFQEIEGEALLLLDPMYCPDEMKKMVEQIRHCCPRSPITYVDHQMTGCTMAKSGLGLAIMPDFICISDPELCQIPFQVDESIPYGIVWRHSHASKFLDEFIKIAKETYHVQTH